MKTTKHLPNPGKRIRLFAKAIFLFCLSAFTALHAWADVIVVPANNGTLISADKASNAIGAAYTVLSDIVISEQDQHDIAETGGVSQTFILTAPAGWIFNPLAGNVSFSVGDISGASISVSATEITLSVNVADDDFLDVITISGIEVQALDGSLIPNAGEIYRSSSNPGGLSVLNITTTSDPSGTGGTSFGSLSQKQGAAAKLAFTTEPALASLSTIFGQQPVVVTQDQFGHTTNEGLLPNLDVTLSLTTGTGILSGTNMLDIGTSAGNGTVTYTDLLINAAGVKRLTASAPGLTSAETADFLVNQAASSVSLITNINPACPGVNINLTASVLPNTAIGSVDFYDGVVLIGSAVISGGQAVLTISTLSAGSHSLTANYSGDSDYLPGNSGTVTQVISPAAPATPGAISGSIAVCPGTTGNVYSISPVADAQSYSWTVPAGWSITAGSGTTSITVTAGLTGQNGNVTVLAANSCGNSSVQSLAVVVSSPAPATPGTISGPTPVCPNTAGLVYSVSPVANATSYNWSLPAGWVITSGAGTNTITVTSGTVAGNVSVSASNSCGTSGVQAKALTLNPAIPATPVSISGPATVCPATTGHVYSISSVPNATTYTWNLPAGWVITSGAGSTSITVTAGAAGQNGNISVTAGNSCGTSAPQTYAVVVSPSRPSAPGTITGSTPVCQNTAGLVYSVAPVANATSYTWTLPAGWSISSGSGTNSITVTSGVAGGTISVAAVNFCGSSDAPQSININPVSATNNTGWTDNNGPKTSDAIMVNDGGGERRGYLKFPLSSIPTGVTISSSVLKLTNNNTASLSNATNYVNALDNNDPVSAAAATLYTAAGSGTTYSSATWSNIGQISLTLNAAANTDIQNRIASPGWIGMGLERGGNSVYNFYGYSGGANAPVLTVNYSAQRSMTVAMNPPVPSTPGTITGSATVCANTSGITYSISSVANATTYNWSVPSGWTITAGQGTTSITVTSGNAGDNGNVSVTAGNVCGSSAAQNRAVTVNPRPTVAALPLTQTICSATAISAINITNPNSVSGTTFTWSRDNTGNLTGMPNSGSGATINGTLTNGTNVQQTTNFTITATAGSCSSNTTVNVKVNPIPSVNSVSNVSVCNNANGSAINFGSNVAGATYSWTSTANIGFGTSGTGNIPSYTATGAPVTATVSVTATANGCSGPVRNFTITVNPLPSVTLSADYCIVPGKVRITATPSPAGSYTYLWSNGATTQVIDVDIAGSYTVTITNANGCTATNSISIATELAVNGNFEAGNVGFTSGYTYVNNAIPNGLYPEGTYTVNNNPNFNHDNFWGRDHTTNTGRMMIVNGLVGPTVWQQSVTIQPNTTYYFSAWALSMNNAAPFAQLQFSVNGSPIGVSAVLIAGVNNNASNTNWQRFYGTWNSGPSTSAVCSIVDLQGALGGNDFALDDISISTLSPAAFSATPSVSGGGTTICQGSNLNLSANLQGGSSPYTFSWTGPGGFTSSLQNPTITGATAANSGTYSLSVTDFYGCLINSSRVITVAAPPSAPSPVTASPSTICLGSSSNLNGTTPNGFQSDFAAIYQPANWSITNNPALTGGSVNTSGAPISISITSGDNGTAGNTDFTITNGPITGNYSFNWSYRTTDGPSRDIPQYSINGGAAVNLPGFNTSGSNNQSGTVTISVPANQTFTLRMRTTNGTGGNATTIFSNFSAPSPGNIIWYTVPVAGTSIGSTVSAANFSVTPSVAGVNSYYAQAVSFAGCASSARTQVDVTVNQPSVAPTSLSASPNVICNGQSTTLTQSGGSLGTGATWKWYSNNTYTTLVGTGTGANASLSVSPTITTTYYLRVEGTASPCTANLTGPAAGVTVTVRQPSIAPATLNASVNPICRGNSTTLTQTGGSLGTGASWKWYSDAAYTVFVGNGTGASASLTVSPLVTTTYYLRAEGTSTPCSANVGGPAAGITITVNQPSTAPTSLTASPNIICNGQSTTLTQTGGSLGTGASWKWYSNNTYTTLVGTGTGATASLTVSPATTTTYYLRIEGGSAPCTATINGPAAGVTVTVSQPSIAPVTLQASAGTICNGSNTTLTQTGGSLGSGATWKWYSDNTYSTLVGTGTGATASLTVSPTVTTTYYLRAEGAASPCASNVAGPVAGVTVTVNQKSANPVSASASVTSICSGGPVNLTITGGGGGTGEVVAWYTGSCGGTLVGTGNNLVVNPTVTTTYYGRYENAAPCSFNTSCVSVTVNVTATGTWLGQASADWNDPDNWCGGVPTQTTNVIIPAGLPNDPVVSSAMATCKDLTIAPGATLYLDDQVLRISGSITSNGGLNAINGTVELYGNTAQNISSSVFTSQTLRRMLLSNTGGVSLTGINDTLKISGKLEFGASNVNLNTNNKLLIMSRATGTASVGDMTSNGLYSGNTITGDVTVERYVPGHPKAWQFLAAPTTGQTIKQAWQENNGPLGNTKPGYGTIITGNIPSATALGFDIETPAASGSGMKTYNANTGLWEGIPSTNIPIANSKGYMLFVRGDRSITAFNQAANETILRTTGKLYTSGADAPPVINVGANQFASVGNPYASAIDFSKLSISGGVQDIFYVWDPKLTSSGNSAYGLGGYQTFIGPGPNYTVIPGGGSFAGGNTKIESGMAFFVRADGIPGTLSFSETAKTDGSNLVTRGGTNRTLQQIKVNLSVVSNGQAILLDGALSQFNTGWSGDIDRLDAVKIGGQGGEQMGILGAGSVTLVAERRPLLTVNDIIQYQFGQLKRQTYRLEFDINQVGAAGLMPYLEDKYLNTLTPLNPQGSSSVDFTVNTQAASSAANRFRIVFRSKRTLLTSEKNDQIQQKVPASVKQPVAEPKLKVYPNPVVGRTLHMQYESLLSGSYTMTLLNQTGQQVYQDNLQLEEGGRIQIVLPANIASGSYLLVLQNKSGRHVLNNVIIN